MAELGTDIDRAAALLRNDALVAIPTETVYGLAGNGLKSQVVGQIYQVKNRPFFDPMILHTDSIDKLQDLILDFPPVLKKLSEAFWPGPLTILLDKTGLVPDLVTSGLAKVAIRIPNHPLTLRLLGKLDFPVAAPSANPFGYLSPTQAQHVDDQLGDLIPYILDGGHCKVGLESTIIVYKNGALNILRKGSISTEMIEDICGIKVKSKTSSSRPLAPGMLDMHYAPRAPLIIDKVENILTKFPSEKVGYLGFTKMHPALPKANQFILSRTANLTEAGQNFFAFLRKLDQLNLAIIVAEYLPEKGLGRAINDKLKRAAVPKLPS